jgi:excisionase family DNA binding protein
MENAEIYTIPEVAKILRVNQVTVNRLIKRQELKAYKIGKVYRITKEELEIYLKKSTTVNDSKDIAKEGFSTAGSLMKYFGAWSGPKEEYDIIVKAIKDADTKAEF